MDPGTLASSTAEAAFEVDNSGRIVIWNRAAERLLGYSAGQAIGKPCFELLCGRDIFGNRYCDKNRNPRKMLRRQEPVRRFELVIRKSNGKGLRVSITVVGFPGPGRSETLLLHLLHPLAPSGKTENAIPSPDRVSDGPSPSVPTANRYSDHFCLTTRELEILTLVAGGSSNRKIAKALFISVTTVRTHIEHILRKLQVHTRAEAVSQAHRKQMIS